MKIWTIATIVAVMLGDAHAGGRDVWGYWYTPDRDSLIRITDCGDGTPCGAVAWVDPERGQVLVDENNPDAALRSRPITGITLLSGFEKARDDWRRGAIYHPGNGSTYRARLRRLDGPTLEVKGCIGPVCRAQHWTKGEARLASGVNKTGE